MFRHCVCSVLKIVYAFLYLHVYSLYYFFPNNFIDVPCHMLHCVFMANKVTIIDVNNDCVTIQSHEYRIPA